MATDARISTMLPQHPKTKKLARRLGPAGPLGCIYLFLWAAANRSDGDMTGLTDEDIELSVDWQGEEGAFVRAMVDVGFLEGEEGARVIHDWAEHNPWAAGAGARSEKSSWAALCKQYGRAEAARRMPEYAQRIGAAPATQPDGTQESASGTPTAVPDSASGTQLAETGSAPSPSPFLSVSLPSPSPAPTQETAPPAPAPQTDKALTVHDLTAEGVDEQHAKDWLKVRAKHKAPLTVTAWNGVKSEAIKARISAAEAVRICAEKSWRGFDSSWDWPGKEPATRAGPPSKQTALEARNAATAQRILEAVNGSA